MGASSLAFFEIPHAVESPKRGNNWRPRLLTLSIGMVTVVDEQGGL